MKHWLMVLAFAGLPAFLDTPVATAGETTLSAAENLLEKYTGENWSYEKDINAGKNDAKKTINCTYFVLDVLEELGVSTGKDSVAVMTAMSRLQNPQKQVTEEAEETMGVAYALKKSGKGAVIATHKNIKSGNVRPGDFIQYWYKSATGSTSPWKGHTGVIRTFAISGDGKKVNFDLIGSHASMNGPGVLAESLTTATSKYYIARIK